MLINFQDKKIYVNGTPTVITAGEIHYFRLHPSKWQHAIDELKNAGFNTVATYIPWVVHEQSEGDMDLDGRHKPQYDIIGFMELVYKNDLYFIARPGPFTMAEMIGEGVPTWVPQKHPSCLPVSWNDLGATTPDLDYLDPGYLSEAEKWYKAIIPEIAKYQDKNLIGIQLDNEMGMLSWVTNRPVLTDNTISDLIPFMREDARTSKLSINLNDLEHATKYIRNPIDSESAVYHDILHDYFRIKIAKYTYILEQWCKDFGCDQTTYMINIHGTGGGTLYGYAIGLSQLYQTYIGKDNYMSGSDIYFDSLTVHRLHDTYLSSILTDAVNGPHQPLGSLEFNSTDTDFGFDHGHRTLACTNNHRARLLLAQGTKLFNFYLFSGGFNDFMNEPEGNGFDRIAITGEKHGYGAPLRPDLSRNYIYDQTAEFGNLVKNLMPILSESMPAHDDISIAFIPDYFKIEFQAPNCDIYKDIVENVKRHTWDSANDVFIRYLLLRNYMPNAINIQDNCIDTSKTKTLLLNSALYMHEDTQKNIVDFIKNGGKLILYGAVPMYDMHGNDCRLVAEALGITSQVELDYTKGIQNKHRIAITPCGPAEGLPATFRERVYQIEAEDAVSVLKVHENDKPVAILTNDSNVFALTADYRCDMQLFDLIFEKLGISSKLSIDSEYIGLSANVLTTKDGGTLINLLNLDDIERTAQITWDNKTYELEFEKHDAILMPINLAFDNYKINYCTNELINYDSNTMTFRLSGSKFALSLTTELTPIVEENFIVKKEDNTYTISIDQRLHSQKYTSIKLV